jgi:hypothetical protein
VDGLKRDAIRLKRRLDLGPDNNAEFEAREQRDRNEVLRGIEARPGLPENALPVEMRPGLREA